MIPCLVIKSNVNISTHSRKQQTFLCCPTAGRRYPYIFIFFLLGILFFNNVIVAQYQTTRGTVLFGVRTPNAIFFAADRNRSTDTGDCVLSDTVHKIRLIGNLLYGHAGRYSDSSFSNPDTLADSAYRSDRDFHRIVRNFGKLILARWGGIMKYAFDSLPPDTFDHRYVQNPFMTTLWAQNYGDSLVMCVQEFRALVVSAQLYLTDTTYFCPPHCHSDINFEYFYGGWVFEIQKILIYTQFAHFYVSQDSATIVNGIIHLITIQSYTSPIQVGGGIEILQLTHRGVKKIYSK